MQGPPEPSSEDGSNPQPKTSVTEKPWMRFVGLGMELATSTLVVAGLGFAIDHYRDHTTLFGTAFGALVGFAIGMVRFIKQASQSVDAT